MSCACCTDYQTTFDRKLAETELADYRSKGLKKMTRPLVDALQKRDLHGLSLLDIGGGIGAIVFELMKTGVSSATNVEISQAYLDVFEKEAARCGLSENTQSLPGDFLDLAPQIEPADIVTLDKVICCYPDYEALVRLSIEKANKYYAFILPQDKWWVKLVEFFEQPRRRWQGKTCKTFVHPVAKIEQLVAAAGFRKIEQITQREWLIVVFEK
jgi:16S rRNA G966 N2-methylase RsmD